MSHRDNRWMEEEANYFAMCLLMPDFLVREECAKIEWDLSSDDSIKYLAKKFDVSITLMAIRLYQLGIFKNTKVK